MLAPRNIVGRSIGEIARCVLVRSLPRITAAICTHNIVAIDDCQALVRVCPDSNQLLRGITKTKSLMLPSLNYSER
jgi:hypothetical protein